MWHSVYVETLISIYENSMLRKQGVTIGIRAGRFVQPSSLVELRRVTVVVLSCVVLCCCCVENLEWLEETTL